MTTRNDLNTPAIALVGLISALLFFASVILLQVIFYHFQSQQRYDNAVSQPPLELTTLIHNQQARLTEYRWIDQKKGIVAIPIDRAMERVVAEFSNIDRPVRKEAGK